MLTTFLVPFLTFLLKLGLSSPVYNMQPAYLTATIGGTGRNIRNLPCISRKSSQSGVCMFAIDCLKANGTHLGTCIDRFYFGSCCHIEKVHEITENTIDAALIPGREPPSRITTERVTTESPRVSTTEAETTRFQTTKAETTRFPTTKLDTTKFVANKFDTTKFVTNKYDTTKFVTNKYDTTKYVNKFDATKVKSTTKFITKKPQIEETTVPYKLQTFQSVDGNDVTTILTTRKPSIAVKPTKIIHKPKPQNTTGLFRPTIKPITRSTLKPRPSRPSLKPSKATRPTAKISVKPVKSTVKPLRVTTSSNKVTTVKVANKITTTSKVSSVTPTLLSSLSTSSSSLPEFSTSQSVSSQTTQTPLLLNQFTPTAFVISSLLTTLAPQSFSTSQSVSSHSTTTQTQSIPPQSESTQSLSSQSESLQSGSSQSESTQSGSSQSESSQSVSSQSGSSQSVTSQLGSSQSVQTQTTPSQSESEASSSPQSTSSSPSQDILTLSSLSSLLPSTTDFVKLPELSTESPVATTISTTTTTEAEINDLLNMNASAILEAVNGNLATNEIVEPGRPAAEEGDLTSYPPLVTWSEIFENATETAGSSSEDPEEWMPITTPDGWVLLPSLSTVTEATSNFTTSTASPATTTGSTSTTTSGTTTEAVAPISTEIPSVDTPEATTNESNASGNVTSTETITTTPSIVSSTDANKGGANMSDYTDVCGRRMFPEARIVGGEKSSFGKWPWQISLRQWRTSTYLHKCGAALLNENWAITAAHCVDNVPPSDLLLRLGEHDLSTESEPYLHQERRVQIVASHPQFDPRTFEYDLALLRFYEPVQFQPNIIPVCVPQNDENFVGRTAYVTGWGRLYEDGPLPSILQEVSVPVINNTVCESMYRSAGYIEHIPNIFICAGWRRGGFDSCEGDSGGPMVIQRQDKRFLLAGVISWGIGCAEPNQPGVYTRISEFRDWINQILQF